MSTYLTAEQKAQTMGKEGYSLSASVCIGLYEIWQPGNYAYQHPLRRAPYIVDTRGSEITCNCKATVKTCKHIAFFLRCRRYWLALQVRAAAQNKPVHRGRFSLKHLAQLRAFQPSLPTPTVSAPIPLTAEQAARRVRVKAMLLADFGEGANT